MPIEHFINATRRNIPERIDLDLYQNFYPLIDFISKGKSAVNLIICYSPERRTELVVSGNQKYLIYDQYLGQTFSNISRIIYEGESPAFGFNYSCKIIAEYFAMKGFFNEAALFARIYNVDDNQLSEIKKTKAPTYERANLVLYQERFLCAHEMIHNLSHSGEKIFTSAKEIVELYFEESSAQKTTFVELAAKDGIKFTDEELDERYPKIESIETDLVNEMTCDMIALDLVSLTSEIYGSDQYPIAALGCFQALKSLQIVSLLRLAVEQYCDGNTEQLSLRTFNNSYQLRAGFLNWLCNNPEIWCADERSPIVDEIGIFLNKFHDNFGTIAISLAELIINRKFEEEFSHDHEYLQKVFTERAMSGEDILTAVDAMCGMPELTATKIFNN